MTSPTAPDPVDTAPPHRARRSDRFFAWVAGLGIARSEGWIGGVAAGIAARLRIDPLIVRGVLVVATVCGVPLILIYAVAWALLPDASGRIHLRELLRGRFEPAHLGILAGIIVGLMSSATLTLFDLMMMLVHDPYYYGYQMGRVTPLSVVGFLLGSALVIVLIVFIVRAARRTPGGTVPPQMSVPSGDSGFAFATDGRGEDAGSGTAASPLAPSPPSPPAPDSATSVEEWRAQHAAWREQEQAWRRQQQDADRAARDRAREERQQAAAAFASEAAERRRILRASNPRAGLAYVATALGVASVVAAGVWLWSTNPDATTAAIALFSAALVLAFGMIIAGVARRRSGFLAFATAATLVAGLSTGGAANVGDVRIGDAWASNVGNSTIIQPFGTLTVGLQHTAPGETSHAVTIRKGSGYTDIQVPPGIAVDLSATVGDVSVQWMKAVVSPDGEFEIVEIGGWPGTALSDGTQRITKRVESTGPLPYAEESDPSYTSDDLLTVPVNIEQQSGEIRITYFTPADKESAE